MCEWTQSTGDGYCEVYGETTRKARKQHTCLACGTSIQRGQKYMYASGIFDNEAFSLKVCLDCLEARDEFGRIHKANPTLDELEWALEHCVKEDGPSSWAVPHLQKMVARREAAEGVRS